MTKTISTQRGSFVIGEDVSSPELHSIFIKTSDGELLKVHTSQKWIWRVWAEVEDSGMEDTYSYYFLDKKLAEEKLNHIRLNWGSEHNNPLLECGMYKNPLHMNESPTNQLNLFKEEI